jgi:hypothetical protein
MHRPTAGRLTALGVLVACAGLVAVAAWLRPDARGFGTHEQLSIGGTTFGPCGFPEHIGIPCPSCGMTTAFAHTVRGQWWRAFRAQPMGWFLAVMTLITAGVCAWSLVRGRVLEVNWYRIDATRVVFLVMLGFVAAWGYKIAAGLLDGTFGPG